MFLDLYYKQESAAYDELYTTIEPHYYEMQYQKEIREEQEKAQLAQEAIQRELDENVTKLATYQALAASLETEVEEAWEAYEAEDDEDVYEGLYEVWEELTEMFEEAESEAQEISWLFEDIEAELAWEAEVARQKKMEEQKNQAYNDAMWAGDMYMEFIVQLQDRVYELDTMRPKQGFNREEIQDALARNRAALDEAWQMYYGAEDVFDFLTDIAYADEEAYYSSEGSRDLTDASARLQQYTDDFNHIG
jgi:hypothetical protein